MCSARVDIFCLSATYFFAFFLLADHPSHTVTPFGNAFICVALTYTLPNPASSMISHKITKWQINYMFNPVATVCITLALTLLCLALSRVCPPPSSSQTACCCTLQRKACSACSPARCLAPCSSTALITSCTSCAPQVLSLFNLNATAIL